MHKITSLKVLEYRKIRITFSDGTEGTLTIHDDFTGAALPLREPSVFATASIIDDGFGIGFKNCNYDICASWAYDQVVAGLPVSVAL